ncbi:hypothetical protein EF912_35570 [Streptomyces sp. WAC07061]|nr:hypothetical protein EF912_35570 [Streptomyces sp. WAC07061]
MGVRQARQIATRFSNLSVGRPPWADTRTRGRTGRPREPTGAADRYALLWSRRPTAAWDKLTRTFLDAMAGKHYASKAYSRT